MLLMSFAGVALAAAISGTNGDDELKGAANEDIIDGLSGDDDLFGRAGADELYGDADEDELFGGNQGDDLYGGSGLDDMFGGAGNDFINASDNRAGEFVNCGLGVDRAVIDDGDTRINCENVTTVP